MSKTAGRLARVSVSSNGGSTWVSLNGLTAFSVTTSMAPINVSSFDSGQFEEYINGRKSGTVSASAHLDLDDAGQFMLFDAVGSGTKILFRERFTEGTGKPERIIPTVISELTESVDNDGAASLEISAQVTGDFSLQTQ